MRRSELLQGLRTMRFENICGRFAVGELSRAEAGELLGVGERTFRRWCQRYREEGEDGLRDRRIGTASANRVPQDEAARVEALYRERYCGFTAKHFHEHLARTLWFHRSYTWTKLFLQRRGLIEAAPRRDAHRRKRPRRPLPGMMLHQDASRHERAFRTLQDRLPKEFALAGPQHRLMPTGGEQRRRAEPDSTAAQNGDAHLSWPG